MESMQGSRWDAALAAGVAFAATTGMFAGLAMLMRPGIVPIPLSHAAIDVVWITPARAPPPMQPRPVSPNPARIATRAQAAREPSLPERALPGVDAPPEPARPLSAIYIDQVRDIAQPAISTSDPLADRRTRLPGEGDGRFRMREPTTVASVVNGIGRMFGGRDPDEPCRENRRNIGELALDGDSEALRQQLDYEHRLCRP